ncbi:MAG: tRNA (guanosine(37)-N1)-methyltransferase TrmD [Candidatus Dojkabacteria bacterium]|nr:tRNA (guanosine(37)-N1)-methyltransferase TrmD [Candidatus Dojkabacteria bacterium]
MRFDILTIFPECYSYFEYSLINKAVLKGLVQIYVHDLRKYGLGKRKNIDDRPYGGGPGMVFMIEPIYRCLKDIGAYPKKNNNTRIFLMSAKGKLLSQKKLSSLTKLKRIVLIAPRYEGVDQRVADYLCDAEISIGKYVLSGGELPAMILVDGVVRLLPGVIGNEKSLHIESFHNGLHKEYPQYTRPKIFVTDEGNCLSVPDILLSGDHKEIERWRLSKISPKSNY